MAVDPLAVAVYGFVQRERVYEEAGIFWEARVIRHRCTMEKRCVKEHAENGNGQRDESPSKEDEEVLRLELMDADNDKYWKFLMKLDSNNCKEQDHYKVLGLSKLRYDATTAEIRHAYRQKVLKHHPDKKKAKGVPIPNEEYYVCITKAFEQIGTNEQKRKAYDSVDEKFDDAIPNEKSLNKDNFFTLLHAVFERNKRWSNTQPAPGLGDMKTPREEVEFFYNFWFDWDSWREFSYLDEEDKEKGEDRWERREMEKMNKAERERRRKDEMKRIRKLVEMAYAKDPRIVQFKKDDKDAKERAKIEKQRAAREKIEEEERKKKEEEERIRKVKEEEQRKAKEEKEAEKAKKNELKKALSEQRKRLRTMAESNKYWTGIDVGDEVVKMMERIEKICFQSTIEDLTSLCNRIENLKLDDEVNAVFEELDGIKVVKKVKVESKSEKEEKDKENQKVTWSSDENTLLIKATNLYPAGTVDRWSVVADYVNEHRKDKKGRPKKEKEVIQQAKLVQTLGMKAVENIAEAASTVPQAEASWSAAEQRSLEQALKQFPSSDPDRWDKIAEAVGTKSKKEAITRYKYIIELVKKNKANGSAV
ncbi:dnj-11 [Pristionchus pacificus]|uniref:Dnj-11 n=1 Tax=Pristionchus pacificus TaxID=54126 RepID=A0A2A6CBR5_PRIPA|nr:dnj-11 [Pristionchus pacificus]|eukprot:PDM75556.1 dnj-11 [Pristionchus pacificus]